MQEDFEALKVEYAGVCDEEKVIATRKEIIKKKLEAHYGQAEHTEKTEFGTFKMVKNAPKWTFSPELTTEQEDLKMRMEDEKEQGIATAVTTFSLRFNTKKEE